MRTTPLLLLQRHPLCSVMLGSLMISFSAVFVKLTTVAPDTAAFYRVFFGGLGLGLLSLLLREPLVFPVRAMCLLIVAALSLSLDLSSWHRSIILVGPGLATILINFQVFFVSIWGASVQGERLPWRVAAGGVLALVGIWFLVSSNGSEIQISEETWPGVLWGLLAAVAFAAYILSIRASQAIPVRLAPLSNMAVASLATAALLAGYSIVIGNSLAIPTPEDGILLLAYGIVSQCAGWLLISQGLPHLPASVGGLSILVMPTFSLVWDILFFDRPMTLWGMCGAIMAILAIRLGIISSSDNVPKNMTRRKRLFIGSEQ